MAFDEIDSIRIRALRAAWRPDQAATLRRIFRWYSEKFHTPLHEVDDLPLEDVLQHYFEARYEDLEPDECHNLAIQLLETPDDRRRRIADEKNSEDDFMRMTREAVTKTKVAQKLRDRVAETKPVLRKPAPETNLPTPKEELTINYTDEPFNMEEDGFGPPPKQRK